MKTYCIDPAYTHREEVPHFDDTPFKDEFQSEVYQYAASLTASAVIDVGCGSAFKLLKYFGHLQTMGVEVEPTLSWLRDTYPHRHWAPSVDLRLETSTDIPRPLLVICSDVIEHIKDPDVMLDYLASIPFDNLVISTPDRVLLNLGTEAGPPRNIHHFREWCSAEFKEYLSTRFEVVDLIQAPTCIARCRRK